MFPPTRQNQKNNRWGQFQPRSGAHTRLCRAMRWSCTCSRGLWWGSGVSPGEPRALWCRVRRVDWAETEVPPVAQWISSSSSSSSSFWGGEGFPAIRNHTRKACHWASECLYLEDLQNGGFSFRCLSFWKAAIKVGNDSI